MDNSSNSANRPTQCVQNLRMFKVSKLRNRFLCLILWVISTLLVLLLITKAPYHDLQIITGRRQSINSQSQNNPKSAELLSDSDYTVTFIKNSRKSTVTENSASAFVFQKNDCSVTVTTVRNLPIEFLLRPSPKKRFNKTCANLPELFDIRINNVQWQHFQFNGGKHNIYLYAAYYDNRSSAKGAFVRILAMTDAPFQLQPSTLCQFWFEDQDFPSFSSRATLKYIWNVKWGYHKRILLPVLITCPVAGTNGNFSKPPSVVSFVEQRCDNSTNALRVTHSELFYNLTHRNETPSANVMSIAVCVKGLTFLNEDKSVRMIEWLELLKLLGVQHVFMYDLAVHPQTRNTLEYYQKSGFVDLTQLNLPGEQMNTPNLISLYFTKKITHKRLNELIPYNDCLYRNMYRYDFIALLDIDEVILPRRRNILTWKEMLEETIPKPSLAGIASSNITKYSSVCARNVYFFDNSTSANLPQIPSYLHMLSHVVRAYNYTKAGSYVKCIHAVDQILTLHNHFPLHCLSKCSSKSFDLSLGHLQHYRAGCTADLAKRCSEDYMARTIIDTTILKYKDKLIENANDVLKELGYLNN